MHHGHWHESAFWFSRWDQEMCGKRGLFVSRREWPSVYVQIVGACGGFEQSSTTLSCHGTMGETNQVGLTFMDVTMHSVKTIPLISTHRPLGMVCLDNSSIQSSSHFVITQSQIISLSWHIFVTRFCILSVPPLTLNLRYPLSFLALSCLVLTATNSTNKWPPNKRCPCRCLTSWWPPTTKPCAKTKLDSRLLWWHRCGDR